VKSTKHIRNKTIGQSRGHTAWFSRLYNIRPDNRIGPGNLDARRFFCSALHYSILLD